MATRIPYTPLDMRCDVCHAAPGIRCRSMVVTGRPVLRRPHPERVNQARTAERNRSQPPVPGWATEAWTCPGCGRSYWPPREWESELWPLMRAQIQQLHANRHRGERLDAGEGG